MSESFLWKAWSQSLFGWRRRVVLLGLRYESTGRCRCFLKWWALMEVGVRNVAGAGHSIPRAMMGARPIVRGDTTRPPYWRFNRRWQQLYLSSYHVSRRYGGGLRGSNPTMVSPLITGYGSAIAAVADNSALSAGMFHHSGLRTVIVSGDTLLPSMRASIEQFFQCKCYDSYGQCRGLHMAMECSVWTDARHSPRLGFWRSFERMARHASREKLARW